MACLFAASYPERTVALVTWGTMARWLQAEGHPWGQTRAEHGAMLTELADNWPSESYVRGSGVGLGEEADSELVADVMRRMQPGASPAAVVALERMNGDIDIRDLLPGDLSPDPGHVQLP